MSYLLFMVVRWFVMIVAKRSGLASVDDTKWLKQEVTTNSTT